MSRMGEHVLELQEAAMLDSWTDCPVEREEMEMGLSAPIKTDTTPNEKEKDHGIHCF